MTLEEAMRARHMVRRYTEKPLPEDVVAQLNQRIEENNHTHHLAIRLMLNDTNAYQGIVKLLLAKGVRNYFIMAGDDAPDLGERLGYAGADLMLFAQTLGLNTWWASGTFSRKNTTAAVGDKKVLGVVAVGYGTTQGMQHKLKPASEVSAYEGVSPEWFTGGVEAALLAPTALNKLAFFVQGKGDEVKLTYKEGAFSGVDKGLVKYHFELGAGKGNFRWV